MRRLTSQRHRRPPAELFRDSLEAYLEGNALDRGKFHLKFKLFSSINSSVRQHFRLNVLNWNCWAARRIPA